MAKNKLLFIVHVLLPITIGGLIYICWREPDLLMFRWLRTIGAGPLTDGLRSFTAPNHRFLPSWFRNSLPDGLWVYALTAFMLLLWRDTGSLLTKAIWGSIGLLLGAGAEIGQLARVVPGTFDYVDLIVCLIAPTAALLFTSRKFTRRNLIPNGVWNETSTKSFILSRRRRRVSLFGTRHCAGQ